MKFKLYHLLVLLGTALLLAFSSKTSSVAARNRDMLYDLSSIEPLDEKVTKAIQKWQTYKFGLFFHWGIYSQLSDLIDIKAHDLASWPLEWSDRGRNNLNITTHEEMTAFRKFYWGLSKTFNPDKFDPNVWAEAAWRAGMRYVVMTTKHHDGFSMYNTTLDSYSVMDRDCPFQRDAFGEVMTAFKKKGFGTGAYYSKVDWHREDFWEPSTFAASRYTNYAPNEKESTWDSFVRFSQNQIVEIMKLYRPDILWFDGGWLNPPMYDMNFADISQLSRDIKDDVIIVNRGGGVFEDYMTPEQGGVPRAPYEKPWEICVTMATQWGYWKNDVYKSMPSLIELLLSVVSTGGNLLLDVGPDPHGQLPKDAMNRLQEFAKWMEYNGEGIHNSEPMYPYKFQSTMSEKLSYQFYLTKRNRDVYSFMMLREKMDPPRKIYMAFVTPTMLGDMPFKLKTVELLSVDEPLPFHFEADSLVVEIPKNLNLGYKYTMTFKLSEH